MGGKKISMREKPGAERRNFMCPARHGEQVFAGADDRVYQA
jgi:hypothetical protein